MVDDDLEVALGVLLVAEGVPASASRVTTPSTRVWTRGDALDLRLRRVRAREVVLAHAGGRVRVEDATVVGRVCHRLWDYF